MGYERVKVDSNQGEIVEALEAVGAIVHQAHAAGGGFVDLVVGFRGVVYLLEVKTKTGRLTKAQKKFHKKWAGYTSIVHDIDEALEAIGAV